MWRKFFGFLAILCLFSCLFAPIRTYVIIPISSDDAIQASCDNSVVGTQSCPLVAINRAENICAPFATSNGRLNWLVNHPAYHYESYHGYFPWAEDDYSPMLPFDTKHPNFRV